MVLCSSYITYGRAKAIVTATALETEVGHIAKNDSGKKKESQTPLQKKLGQTGKILGIGALVICLVIFCMGLLTKADPFEMFMTSVSLAVAAITRRTACYCHNSACNRYAKECPKKYHYKKASRSRNIREEQV